MALSERQKNEFLKYIKKAEYENHTFSFGPYDRDKSKYLYGILFEIGAGYYASHAGNKICFECGNREMKAKARGGFVCSECKNEQSTPANSKGPFYVYVSHGQAEKVLKFVSGLTGQSYAEITNGKYTEPVKTPDKYVFSEISSKPKEKKKKGRKKKKAKTEKKKEFEKISVSFKEFLK